MSAVASAPRPGLPLPRRRDGDRRRLRRLLEGAGRRLSGLPARRHALRDRGGGDGAVAAPAGGRARRSTRAAIACCSSNRSSATSCSRSACCSASARASALAAGVIMAALPAVVALLSWWLLERAGRRARRRRHRLRDRRHRPGRVRARRRGRAGERLARSASLLLVGAVTCEALYVVIGKKLSATIGPKRISALINLWGLVLVAPFALWQLRGFSPSFIPESSWWLLARLFDRRQRRHRLAVDDRAEARAGVVGRHLHRASCRSAPRRSARSSTASEFTTAQAAAFALALAGVVLAAWPARRAGVGRGRAAERLTRQPRHRRRRLALQPRIRPDLAPAARPGLAVAQAEDVARRVRPRLAGRDQARHVVDHRVLDLVARQRRRRRARRSAHPSRRGPTAGDRRRGRP